MGLSMGGARSLPADSEESNLLLRYHGNVVAGFHTYTRVLREIGVPMGRSVMVPGDAAFTVYTHFECGSDDYGPDEWDDFVTGVVDNCQRLMPSMTDEDRWVGRESRVIAENDHGCVVICEYCGLVSISLVPKPTARGRAWVERVGPRWKKRMDKWYSGMQSLGYASNGEQFFVRG